MGSRRRPLSWIVLLALVRLESPAGFLPAQPALPPPRELFQLANDTGGRAVAIEHAERLTSVYEDIGAELRHLYRLAFVPSDVPADGAWRRLSVRVPGRADARVRTRAGYYAPCPGHTRGNPPRESRRGPQEAEKEATVTVPAELPGLLVERRATTGDGIVRLRGRITGHTMPRMAEGAGSDSRQAIAACPMTKTMTSGGIGM